MRRATLFAAGAVTLAGAYAVVRYATQRQLFRAFATPNATLPLNIPGPAPILGGAGNTVILLSDPIRVMGSMFERYGNVVAMAQGVRSRIISPLPACPGTVFVTGPELIREVTTQHDLFYKYSAAGTFYPVDEAPPRLRPLRQWGAGLFNVNGDLHRMQRRLMLPAFHRKRVEAYRDQMVTIIDAMLATWQPGEQRNIHHDMMGLTMRIATAALFGDDLAEEGERISRAIEESLHIFFRPLTGLLRYDLPGLPYRRFLDLAAEIEQGMLKLVARKREVGRDQGDVLAMLIQARDEQGLELSEEELIGHVSLLFAAGHETSSNALTWTLFLLSQHPKIAHALLEELDGVLHGAAPTIEQLRELPLLDRVIRESMRLFPPVPWNTRVVHQATTLGGYAIPAGTEIMMSIYHTHHDPQIYPNPERFDPARWETIDPSTFEYTPFSGGPRMCIGATFATMEMKLVLAMLMQRFRLELVPGARIDRSVTITMSPRQGMPMRIHQQDRQFAQPAPLRGNVREMVEL